MEGWLQNRTPPRSKKIKNEEKGEEVGEESTEKSSKFATCPVCNKSVSKSSINSHVEACLVGSNEVKSSRSGDKNPSEFTLCKGCNGSILNATYEAHVELCKANAGKRKRTHDDSVQADDHHPTTTTTQKPKKITKWAPLAERLRPTELEEVLGQDQLLGDSAILKSLISRDSVPSMILWGPPGCGKTTIARIIASHTKTNFVSLSAVTSGVADVKKTVAEAQALSKLTRQRTTLFLDEIHRFNKLQQDLFLPYVENGTITLIGATTENPSFEVNSALLSRCKVFVLQKLQSDHIKQILITAIRKFNELSLNNEISQDTAQNTTSINYGTLLVEGEVLDILSELADGDARTALNILDLAIEANRGDNGNINITVKQIQGAMQKTHLLYDKKSDQHYNVISALHKSMRGGDANAALYWLGRMLEGGEEPLYVARRLIRFASEDVGLADPNALVQAVAAFQASHMIGMPECNVVLAQCVAYLSRAPKSNAIYVAYGAVKECIQKEPTPPVPLHISNAPTNLMKQLGYAKGYKYTPDYPDPKDAKQDYLPDSLKDRIFFKFPG